MAALASHVAVYGAGSLVLVLAPSQNQSFELYRKITAFYRLAATPDADAESARRVELANGSRIVCLSGNPTTVRGYSAPALIIVDEAAFAEDDLFGAITPMLANGGRLVLLSTPNGRQGYFFDQWEHGGTAWERTKVTAYDTPRLPTSHIELERATKPDRDFRREYLCEFVDVDEQLFSSALIDRAFATPAAPLFSAPFEWTGITTCP
ncbi:terminase family protein [Sphingosinicellaceae bacterium]|nr:terminase family protein [Sphingosinicellaceae bacterium]